MNRIVQTAIDLFPWKDRIVNWGAVLPPSLRCPFSCRAFSAVAQRTTGMELIKTNMGIDRQYECLIPRSYSNVVFGVPDLYAGERAPLELAAILSQSSDAFVDIGAH